MGGQDCGILLAVIGPLFRGDLDVAQTALDQISSDADPWVQFRVRALGADILRDRGLFAEAAGCYGQLLAEFAGTSREGVLRQHLGKVYFVAGNYRAARDCFAEALRLRRSQGAYDELIESSIMALERADEGVIRKAHQELRHLPGS
jgi:tetratricopeptide (TPR) repeat protein